MVHVLQANSILSSSALRYHHQMHCLGPCPLLPLNEKKCLIWELDRHYFPPLLPWHRDAGDTAWATHPSKAWQGLTGQARPTASAGSGGGLEAAPDPAATVGLDGCCHEGGRDSDRPAVVPEPAARPDRDDAVGSAGPCPCGCCACLLGSRYLHQRPWLSVFLNKQFHRRKYWKLSSSKDSTRHIAWWSRQIWYSNRAGSCASSYSYSKLAIGVSKFSLHKPPPPAKTLVSSSTTATKSS